MKILGVFIIIFGILIWYIVLGGIAQGIFEKSRKGPHKGIIVAMVIILLGIICFAVA